MEQGLAILKKKKSSHTSYNMMTPEDIMLSDRARCEKPHTLLYYSICTKCPKHVNPQTQKVDVLARGCVWGEGSLGVSAHGYGASSVGDGNVLELNSGDDLLIY